MGSMQYLNYSTKTLVKSSRVAFTVMTGQLFVGKRYNMSDYFVVFLIIIGLGMFLHADATTSVIFHPVGIAFLVSMCMSCTLHLLIFFFTHMHAKCENR